jgi:hypothetical protein
MFYTRSAKVGHIASILPPLEQSHPKRNFWIIAITESFFVQLPIQGSLEDAAVDDEPAV